MKYIAFLFLFACGGSNSKDGRLVFPVEEGLVISSGQKVSCLIDNGELARDGSHCVQINASKKIVVTSSSACSEFFGTEVKVPLENKVCPLQGRVAYSCEVSVLDKHKGSIEGNTIKIYLYEKDQREAQVSCRNFQATLRRMRSL